MRPSRHRGIVRDTGAATAIEYALLGGLIAVVIVAALTLIGTDIANTFNAAANSIQ